MKHFAGCLSGIVFVAVMLLCGSSVLNAQGVAVNTSGSQADPSSMLDVNSNTKGVLISRMTTAERNAITAPAEGLTIFNTDTKCFNFFRNNGWYEWCGNCIAPAAPLAGNNGPLCAGSTLNLTASTVPFATYSWSGPNGFTSTLQNPSISNVTSANSGSYSVVSVVNCNSVPATTNAVITGPVSSAFTWNPPYPGTGNAAVFTPALSGASYSWTFQNGNPASSTVQNPSVTWSSGGTFDVTLTVTQNGCVSGTTTHQITVTNCSPGSTGFSYTGSVQTWTVPTCVSSITVTANGAQGGGPIGGNGGQAIATIPVTGGATLYIYVGGQPTTRPGAGSGGFNGGGAVNALPCGGGTNDGWGGGGASDVRTSTSLTDRIIVAAGGGGSGYSGRVGGTGGGLTGGPGVAPYGTAPTGGTQTGGGLAGVYNGVYAGAGALGTGGDAAPTSSMCIGGGGGGGYYGGGGGYTSSGAGGSSWVSYPGSTNASTNAGTNTGNGSVTISW
ncbi:MAG: glycine-rich protein [Bacteroidota bacterium]